MQWVVRLLLDFPLRELDYGTFLFMFFPLALSITIAVQF